MEIFPFISTLGERVLLCKTNIWTANQSSTRPFMSRASQVWLVQIKKYYSIKKQTYGHQISQSFTFDSVMSHGSQVWLVPIKKYCSIESVIIIADLVRSYAKSAKNIMDRMK
jgi:hypothetical protein